MVEKGEGLNIFEVGEKFWFIAGPLIIGIIGAYIIVLVYFSIFQARLVYFPEKIMISTPETIGLQYEDVSLKTADGVSLFAWFIPSEKSKGTILFCHGNAGNISHRLETIQIFHRMGLNILIFDYRGYGKSGGKPSEKGTYLDAEAAWKYLVEERKIKPAKIILYGRSVGGAIAAWLAKEQTIKAALIMESTFTSVKDLGAQVYPFLPIRLMSRFNYSALDYLSQVNCPVLIIHSRDDEIIPISHGEKLFEIANEPKSFLEIKGTHNAGFIISAESYEEGLDAFISNILESKD